MAVYEPYSFKAVLDEIRVQEKIENQFKTHMSFEDAIDRKYLVYEDVKELPKLHPARIKGWWFSPEHHPDHPPIDIEYVEPK